MLHCVRCTIDMAITAETQQPELAASPSVRHWYATEARAMPVDLAHRNEDFLDSRTDTSVVGRSCPTHRVQSPAGLKGALSCPPEDKEHQYKVISYPTPFRRSMSLTDLQKDAVVHQQDRQQRLEEMERWAETQAHLLRENDFLLELVEQQQQKLAELAARTEEAERASRRVVVDVSLMHEALRKSGEEKAALAEHAEELEEQLVILTPMAVNLSLPRFSSENESPVFDSIRMPSLDGVADAVSAFSHDDDVCPEAAIASAGQKIGFSADSGTAEIMTGGMGRANLETRKKEIPGIMSHAADLVSDPFSEHLISNTGTFFAALEALIEPVARPFRRMADQFSGV